MSWDKGSDDLKSGKIYLKLSNSKNSSFKNIYLSLIFPTGSFLLFFMNLPTARLAMAVVGAGEGDGSDVELA